MSGNVGEMTSHMLNGSPSIYGGGYCSSVTYITKTSSVNYYYYNYGGDGVSPGSAGFAINSSGKSTGVGFRLILTCP